MKKFFLFAVILLAAQFSRAQWEPDVRLTNDPSSSHTAYSPGQHAIATSGDTVHVVWCDSRDGNSEIYYKRSTDDGLTWGEDIRLTNDPASSFSASIAVSGSDVHVTWCDSRYYWLEGWYEIYYKHSPDGGNNWEPDTRLSYYEGNSFHPSLVASGESVHVIWYEQYEDWWEILYKRSTNGGVSWEDDVRLTNDPGFSGFPSICASGTVLHVAWYDNRDVNSEIYYKRSTDAGLNWGADTRLTFTDFSSALPCVGVSESDVHVVWMDKRDGIREIYYKRSTDGGISWGEDQRLTEYCSESSIPAPNLAVSGTGLFVVWEDDRDGNQKIYYKHSSDGGMNWEPDIRLTDDTDESNYPFVSVSGCQLNVVWTDARDGNYEIYYKRDPTGWDALTADFTANSTTICHPGDTVQFTDLTTCEATQWLWTFQGGTPDTSTQQNPQVVYNTQGAYDVSLFASNGSSDDLITKTGYIDVYEMDIPEIPPKPQGPDYVDLAYNKETDYTTEGSSGSTFYEWSMDPSNAGTISIPENTSALVTWNPDFLGMANLSVRGANECFTGGWSEAFVITVANTFGFSETASILPISIFPNPNNGIFWMILQSNKQEVLTLRVFNILGETIFEEKKVTLNGHDNERIELTGAPSGIYFLQISNGSLIWMHKIIILKN